LEPGLPHGREQQIGQVSFHKGDHGFFLLSSINLL
jgi:hypothetical protein